ncbi:hypothetical protein FBU59_001331, partial [Linderina macrospora]
FGFEDGGVYSLDAFKRKSDEFKRKWFPEYYNGNPRPSSNKEAYLFGPQMEGRVPEDVVEEEFWRLVASPYEEVEVEYGADLHSAQHGSGFPTAERDPLDPYARHPWNLTMLPFQPTSLFNHIQQDISGMMTPWIYVGMCFSTFCWHNEDHYTFSVNYQHWGDTKTWYGVPGRHAEMFEQAMRDAVPQLFEDQPDLLFQLVTMLSPKVLVDRNVDVFTVDQRAGEFVVTFPQSYHSGFNQGLNFNEAVNFATADWMPYDIMSVKRYQQYARNPVFSHDELLVTMLENDRGYLQHQWFQDAVVEMANRELEDRKFARELWSEHTIVEKEWEPQDDTEAVDEFQQQCLKCKAFAYLSGVSCSCSPHYVSCPLHADKSCKCGGDKKTLKYRYTDEELQGLLSQCNQTESKAQIWESEFRRVMSLYSADAHAAAAVAAAAEMSTAGASSRSAQESDDGRAGVREETNEHESLAATTVVGHESQDDETPKAVVKRSGSNLVVNQVQVDLQPTIRLASLNVRPDLALMIVLLEEAQRLVLDRPVPTMVSTPTTVGNATVSDRVENEQMALLSSEIERLFAAYPGNPSGSEKDLASRVDLRVLGDVRQLGRFVQAANMWCAAAQALLACTGHVELVSKMTQRRAANYQWHRRKWAERMGGRLGRVASDMDGSMEVEQRVFIAELIERDEQEAASRLEAEAKADGVDSGTATPQEKRYRTDSEEDQESSEENNDDEDDGDFRINAPVRGRGRGKRGLRSAAVTHGVKRTRRSRSGLRAGSHDSKESTPAPSAGQKMSRRPSTALPRVAFSSSLIANMTRGDMLMAVCKAIGADDSDGTFTLDDLQMLLQEGDKLFFNSPELDTLLQLEKRALVAVNEMQQLATTSPEIFNSLDGVSRSPDAYGAEQGAAERLSEVRQRIGNVRREMDQIGLEFAHADSLWQIEGMISWSSECQDRFRQRSLTQDAMEDLLSEGRRLSLDPNEVALYARLCDVRRSAVEWEEDAQHIIESDSVLDLRNMGVLLEKGRNLEFLPPSYERLRKLQQRALDIQAYADRLVERMGADNITFRPEYADMRQFIDSYQHFARFCPSSADRLEAELNRADEWWMRMQSAFATPDSNERASDRVRVLSGVFRLAAEIAEGKRRPQNCICLWPVSDSTSHACMRCGEAYHDVCMTHGDLQNLAVWGGAAQTYVCPLCSHRLQPQAWERHYPSVHRINRLIERARELCIVMEDLDPLVGVVLHARTLVRVIAKDLANPDA